MPSNKPNSSASTPTPTPTPAAKDADTTKPAVDKAAAANTAILEEDDEFEDFPVEDWSQEDTAEGVPGGGSTTTHLWEESWDDDDENEEFSKQLREELDKTNQHK